MLCTQLKGKSVQLVSDEVLVEGKHPKEIKGFKKHVVDLFCYVPFDGDLTCSLVSTTERRRIELRETYYDQSSGTNKHRMATETIRTKIKATLPGGLGPNLQRERRLAVAHLYKLWGELLSDDAVGEHLVGTECFPETPKFGAIWIPTEACLNVKSTTSKKKDELPKPRPIPRNYDPAMIFSFLNHHFLVKMWAVDDEKPLENYLREFTTGSLENVR